MQPVFALHAPLPGLGMTSLVLGVIALLLAFLPILGIPLSLCGLVLGRWALSRRLSRRQQSPLGSCRTSDLCLALTTNVAIAYAPGGYFPDHTCPALATGS